MTIYSLYIYDRHCDCVYYQAWHRVTATRPGKDVLQGVGPELALNVQDTAFPSGSAAVPTSTRFQSDTPAEAPPSRQQPNTAKKGLPFDEESKLIYGILFSLRSMVKKLSPKEDEQFIAYKTSTYKMHLFETPSGYKFILFSDPSVESLRFVLKSIYQTAFVEFVVRNPMVGMDSRVSGKGIDNQAFRAAVNNFVSSLSVFR